MTVPAFQGFQEQVNAQPAPGQPGDLYGTNPRAVVIAVSDPQSGVAGPGNAGAQGALVSPASPDGFAPAGLVIGNFAWADLTTQVVSQGYNPSGQIGLPRRDGNAVITAFLGIASYVLNAGFLLTLFSKVDMWVKFAAGSAVGQNVYADPVTGAAIAGSTAPTTASFTGAITTGVLTVSAIASGTLGPGAVIAGAGVTAGNRITAQLTGVPGGLGTYQLSVADTGITAEAMTVAGIATGWKVKRKVGNGEIAVVSNWS
jgi:hypothetical protein